jgi:hypothetical protein
MTIKARLNKDQLFRLAVLRHIEKPTFFFNAFTSAGLIAYAIWQDIYVIMFVAWMPFVLYIALGVFEAFRASRDRNNPLLLPTTYEFTEEGISITTNVGKGHLEWEYIGKVKVVLDCYVFYMTNGQMVAIPRSDVPPHRKKEFEQFVHQQLARK